MPIQLVSHRLCPYVQRAVIALEEKNIPTKELILIYQTNLIGFLALSPTGKVPLLRIDNHVLFESNVICEYLEDTVSPALHPANPIERARHRAYMEYGSNLLQTIWQLTTCQDAGQYQKSAQDLKTKIAHLEKVLSDQGPFFAGENFSMVDAVFAPIFRYFYYLDPLKLINWDSLPKVSAWRAALASRPSVQKAVFSNYLTELAMFIESFKGYITQELEKSESNNTPILQST